MAKEKILVVEDEEDVLELVSFNLEKGVKVGYDKKSEYYLPAGGADSGHVITYGLADPFEAIRLSKKNGKLCAVSIYNYEGCTSKVNYI
jgi:CheY-like chemotaxis protein